MKKNCAVCVIVSKRLFFQQYTERNATLNTHVQYMHGQATQHIHCYSRSARFHLITTQPKNIGNSTSLCHKQCLFFLFFAQPRIYTQHTYVEPVQETHMKNCTYSRLFTSNIYENAICVVVFNFHLNAWNCSAYVVDRIVFVFRIFLFLFCSDTDRIHWMTSVRIMHRIMTICCSMFLSSRAHHLMNTSVSTSKFFNWFFYHFI